MKKLSQKTVVLYSIMTGFVYPMLTLLLGSIVAAVVFFATDCSEEAMGCVNSIAVIFFTVLAALWIKKKSLKGEFSYGLGSKGLKLSFLLTLPVLAESLLYVFSGFLSMINGPIKGEDVLIPLLLGIQPGITEEIFYRGLVFGGLMQFRAGKKNRVLVAFLASTLMFSLIHMVNMFSGQSFIGTVSQLLFALAMGSTFCASYMRSRNLWGPIILHAFHDAFAFFLVRVTEISSDGAVSGIQIAIYLALIAYSCYIIFSTKPEYVDRVWGAAKPEEEDPTAAVAV